MKVSKCCNAQVELMPSNDADREDVSVCQNCNHVCQIIDQQEQPTPEPMIEYWEKEFERKSDYDKPPKDHLFMTENDGELLEYPESMFELDLRKVKSFIKKLLSNQRKQIMEELRKEVLCQSGRMSIVDNDYYFSVDDILSLLK
jgi:hypothetical protein